MSLGRLFQQVQFEISMCDLKTPEAPSRHPQSCRAVSLRTALPPPSPAWPGSAPQLLDSCLHGCLPVPTACSLQGPGVRDPCPTRCPAQTAPPAHCALSPVPTGSPPHSSRGLCSSAASPGRPANLPPHSAVPLPALRPHGPPFVTCYDVRWPEMSCPPSHLAPRAQGS